MDPYTADAVNVLLGLMTIGVLLGFVVFVLNLTRP